MNRTHQTQRKSIRLESFDYSSAGAYFVTICTQLRGFEWFGAVTRDGVQLNDAGLIVLEVWNDIPTFYPGIQIDAFVIMPDHVHGIITIEPVGVGPRARPAHNDDGIPNMVQSDASVIHVEGQTQGSAPTVAGGSLSLPDVVQRFKSLTTIHYIKGVRERGWTAFEKWFWQRNYWEHIIRDEHDLDVKRNYIFENPTRWLEARRVA